jgi:YHS domain-containing protein
MNKIRTLALLLVVGFSLGAAADAPVNKTCPMKGQPVNPNLTSVYMGKTLGFCCNNCKGQFDANPAKFIGLFAADLKAADAKKSDKPDPKAAAAKNISGPCDCKKLAKGWYCAMCKRDLMAEDVRNNACKRCETKPLPIEYCVKLIPKTLSKQEIKDGKPPFDEDRARISYECESCGVKGDVEAEIKHKPDCKPKAIGSSLKKVCAKSGKFPHATDESK